MTIFTNASTFCENIQAEQIKDIAYYRSYIPDADPIVAKEESEKRCHKLRGEITLAMINCVKVGEIVSLAEVVKRSGLPKTLARDRLRRCGSFERVKRGFYKRLK